MIPLTPPLSCGEAGWAASLQLNLFIRSDILPGRFDPYKFSSADMARTHSLVVEAIMDDEQNQVCGYSYVNDEAGLTAGHLSLWSLSDIRKIIRCMQDSTPMRHKATHFLNVPSLANKMFEFFTMLLNEKLRDRIMVSCTYKRGVALGQEKCRCPSKREPVKLQIILLHQHFFLVILWDLLQQHNI